eukprot:jgi/Tetstr1/443994/TSEL_003297.t1
MFGAKWETVRKWVERFEATGDVRDACRPGRPSKGLMLSPARLVIQRGVQKRFTCKKIAATVKTKLDIDVTAETVLEQAELEERHGVGQQVVLFQL